MKKSFYCFVFAAMIISGCKNANKSNNAKEAAEETPDYAGWTIGSFTDQFGEITDDHFLSNKCQGQISASTSGYVDMTAKCVIDSSKFRMDFYEYGKYPIENCGHAEISIKDTKGKIHEFRQNSCGGIWFLKEERDSIINIFSQDGDIKVSVHLEENSRGRGGRFSMRGTSHLKDLLAKAKINR